MQRSEDIGQLAAALAAAQGKMKPAGMNAVNPFLKNTYADLGAVIEAIRPILADNGLSFTQLPETGDGTVTLETVIMHASGQWISSVQAVSVDAEKGLSSAQITGKAITYLRRYALSAMFGVYADKDDDGNEHVDPETGEIRPRRLQPAPKATRPQAQPAQDVDPLIARYQAKAANFASAPRPTNGIWGATQAVISGIVGGDDNRHRFYSLLFKREIASANDLTNQEAAWLLAFIRADKTPDGWAAHSEAEQAIVAFMQRHPAPAPAFPAAADLHPESAHQSEPA